MKLKERDELLIRLDERTRNIWRVTEQQEKHLVKLNGAIVEQIKQMGEQGKQVASNRTHIWWIIRIFIACGVLGSGVTGLIQWLG